MTPTKRVLLSDLYRNALIEMVNVLSDPFITSSKLPMDLLDKGFQNQYIYIPIYTYMRGPAIM